ncbi:thioredoxin family protein [Planctomicrobium sp. SH668]|uniref:thioredoxin family protein n=1 Tax=Planctomicrobium sp. SH668 TaxID=3448126 RepID=UPI003F5C2465
MGIWKVFAALVFVMLLLSLRHAHSLPPLADDPEFRAMVKNSTGPLLVKFGAEWCPPCLRFDDMIATAPAEIRAEFGLIKIDVEDKPKLAAHYQVRSIPHVLLFKDGELLAQAGTFRSASELQRWIHWYARDSIE